MNSVPGAAATDKPSKPRCRLACNFCRSKKIRCDGRNPCANCCGHGEECISSVRRRPRRKGKGAPDIAANTMTQRLSRLEALLGATAVESSDLLRVSETVFQTDGCDSTPVEMMPDSLHLSGESTALPEDIVSSSDRKKARGSAPARDEGSCDRRDLTSTPLTTQTQQSLTTDQPSRFESDRIISAESSDEKLEASSVCTGERCDMEYHGPRSYLSICSKPGVQWVSERTGDPLFHKVAGTLARDVTHRLKIDRKLSRNRVPEPDIDSAWVYVRAYFDEASDAAFDVVDRTWFESQLRTYSSGSVTEEDPAWYALRNAIYASGCRLELTKRCTFRDAYQKAWGYFENALSVHTELLYFKTSLLAVQALTVMAYFTEAVGSPCLEYMLGANAARLAYSKGLHRQPVSSWNLGSSEEHRRICLFWAIYCLEKNCSRHSGRPSSINDHEVSCQVLTSPPPGSNINIEYATHVITLSKMVSQVTEKFSNVQRFRSAPEDWVNAVIELDSRYIELGKSLGELVSPDTPMDCVDLSANMKPQQAIFIRLLYCSIGLDIHAAITCPWSRLRKHPRLHSQIQKSSVIVAKLSRHIIHATNFIRINASTSMLLAFGAPMYSLINLFIYILQNPELPTVQSDLALMDIGAAHFARLEVASELDISITFAREIATLARSTVKHHKDTSSVADSFLDYGNLPDLSQQCIGTGAIDYNGNYDFLNPTRDGQMASFFDLELDHQSAFLAPHFVDDRCSALDIP